MKLTYRGISYEYEPTAVQTTEAGVGGKYRGLDWRFRNLKKPPTLQPTVGLTYRGVHYQKPGSATTTTEKTPVPAVSLEQKTRSLMVSRIKATEKRQQSMLHRSAAALGLKEIAYKPVHVAVS